MKYWARLAVAVCLVSLAAAGSEEDFESSEVVVSGIPSAHHSLGYSTAVETTVPVTGVQPVSLTYSVVSSPQPQPVVDFSAYDQQADFYDQQDFYDDSLDLVPTLYSATGSRSRYDQRYKDAYKRGYQKGYKQAQYQLNRRQQTTYPAAVSSPAVGFSQQQQGVSLPSVQQSPIVFQQRTPQPTYPVAQTAQTGFIPVSQGATAAGFFPTAQQATGFFQNQFQQPQQQQFVATAGTAGVAGGRVTSVPQYVTGSQGFSVVPQYVSQGQVLQQQVPVIGAGQQQFAGSVPTTGGQVFVSQAGVIPQQRQTFPF